MAYKFQRGNAILSGALEQEGDITIDGGKLTASAGFEGQSLTIGNAVVLSSAKALQNVISISGAGAIQGASLDINGNATLLQNGNVEAAAALVAATTVSGAGQLQGASMDVDGEVHAGGMVSSSAELKGLSLYLDSVEVTSTATELNLLDGVTATTNELNILDGVTATAAEINILDGATLDVNELNLLDGVTATTSELNILDGVTATAAELNLVDGSSAGAIVNNKAVIYDAEGDINANIFSGSGDASFLALDINGNQDVIDSSANFSGGNVTSQGVVSGSGDAEFLALDINGNQDVIDSSANFSGGNVTSQGIVSGSGDAEFLALDINGNQDVIDSSANFSGGNVTSQGIVSGSGDASFLALDINGNQDVIDSSANFSGGNVTAEGNISGSGTLQLGSTVRLDGVADATLDVTADSLYFLDGDNLMKSEAVSDFVSSIAGAGLAASNGVLSTQAGSVAEVKVGSLTLSEGYNYMTASAALALVLPAAPSNGDVVVMKTADLSGVTVTITGGAAGHQIDGEDAAIVLESPYSAVSLVYVKANDWRIV